MHQQLRQVSAPSQDGDLDYATMVAELDVISRAPRKPLSPEHEITGPGLPYWRARFERMRTAPARRTALNARLRKRYPDGPDGMKADAANDDEISPSTAPSFVPDLVKKPCSRLRRKSGLRQSADARNMRDAGRVTRGEAVKHPAPFHHTKTTNDNAKPQTKRARRERGLASWDDAGELPRIIAVNRAVTEMGIPFAWSLNLGPAQIQAANDNARGFLDHLRRKVARYLKNELRRSASFWFVLETDANGRPHLHGGLVLNDNDDPAAVERALAKAGGAASSQGSKPADIRPQHDPDGWAAYSTKRIGRTKRHLRDLGGLDLEDHVTIWTCTDDLRTEGKRLHEEARQAIQEARQRPPAVPGSSHCPSNGQVGQGASDAIWPVPGSDPPLVPPVHPGLSAADPLPSATHRPARARPTANNKC